jgi:3-hydroxyisobutyrate dehydrogenase
MARMAVLGLGAMGSRMALRLIAAGHQVTVWNRSPTAAAALQAEGAIPAETPREAASGAGIVIAMLRDDGASRTVWTDGEEGALAGLGAEALAVECSTLSPGWMRDLAAAAAGAGRAFLAAPLVGSRPQAEAGALVFLAGGGAAEVARAEPVLRAMGSAVHHVGDAPAAATAKLVVNALFAVQVAAVAELLGLLRRAGADPARVLEAMAATPVLSGAAGGAARGMLAGAFAPQFPVGLVRKDLGYATALARAPMTAAAAAVLEEAAARGLEGENLTAVAKLYG